MLSQATAAALDFGYPLLCFEQRAHGAFQRRIIEIDISDLAAGDCDNAAGTAVE